MSGQIDITLTKTRYEQPLVVVRESPLSRLDSTHTPEQLRRIAAALILIADDAEGHSPDMPDVRRAYPL